MDKATASSSLTRKHEAYLGLDVGKESHWAYAADSMGTVLFSRRVANSETELDALLTRCPEDTLAVVDQRRNIGALAIKRARKAGRPVATCRARPSTSSRRAFPASPRQTSATRK